MWVNRLILHKNRVFSISVFHQTKKVSNYFIKGAFCVCFIGEKWYFVVMNQYKAIRKGQKIGVIGTGLDARTVRKIESGSEKISVEKMRVYLAAIGLRLCVCLAE